MRCSLDHLKSCWRTCEIHSALLSLMQKGQYPNMARHSVQLCTEILTKYIMQMTHFAISIFIANRNISTNVHRLLSSLYVIKRSSWQWDVRSQKLYITLLNIKAKKGGFRSKATEEPLWVSKRTSQWIVFFFLIWLTLYYNNLNNHFF